jgi:2,3-dihydroxybenzoate decarboxylase
VKYPFYNLFEYSVFWGKCAKISVPLYLHPFAPTGRYFEQMYARKYLVGPLLASRIECLYIS